MRCISWLGGEHRSANIAPDCVLVEATDTRDLAIHGCVKCIFAAIRGIEDPIHHLVSVRYCEIIFVNVALFEKGGFEALIVLG